MAGLQTSRFILLTGYTIVRVRGRDPGRFLQGQLTCDVNEATPGRVLLGGACTPQGRLFATFYLYLEQSGDILLRLPSSIVEHFIQTLSRYAALSRASLHDLRDEYRSIGLLGPVNELPTLNSAAALTARDASPLDGGVLIRHDQQGHRHELWVPSDQLSDWLAKLRRSATEASQNEWILSLIRAGECELAPELIDEFVPQMINLDLLGGVSFRKGCYTGQEIVARAKYRGKIKRRLFLGEVEADADVDINASVVSVPDGKNLGVVVSFCKTGSRCEFLAVLNTSSVDEAGLRLFDTNGPRVILHDLPYGMIAS